MLRSPSQVLTILEQVNSVNHAQWGPAPLNDPDSAPRDFLRLQKWMCSCQTPCPRMPCGAGSPVQSPAQYSLLYESYIGRFFFLYISYASVSGRDLCKCSWRRVCKKKKIGRRKKNSFNWAQLDPYQQGALCHQTQPGGGVLSPQRHRKKTGKMTLFGLNCYLHVWFHLSIQMNGRGGANVKV